MGGVEVKEWREEEDEEERSRRRTEEGGREGGEGQKDFILWSIFKSKHFKYF